MVTDEFAELYDDDGATEISLGLNLSSDDEFAEPTASGDPASCSNAGAPAADVNPELVPCKHCTGDASFADHSADCPQAGVYRRYVECPRCRCVLFTRGQLRAHSIRCLADDDTLTNDQKRNRYNPKSMMRECEAPIVTTTCAHCKRYQHQDKRVVALHEVFCRDQDKGRPPVSLPSRAALYSKGDEMTLPLQLACAVSAVFKRHVAWKVHTRFGFLWLLAERAITCASPQVVTANTEAHTPEDSQSPARPAVKSVVVKPASPHRTADRVSPLIVKRTVSHEERRRKRHRARREEPQYTVTKRRHRENTPSPPRRSTPPRLAPKQRKRSHTPPPARWPQREAHATPPLGASPTKAFSFGQLAVITPTQRCPHRRRRLRRHHQRRRSRNRLPQSATQSRLRSHQRQR